VLFGRRLEPNTLSKLPSASRRMDPESDRDRVRPLGRGMAVRQLLALALAPVGHAASREQVFTVVGAAARERWA
jgi:hypothetical protein